MSISSFELATLASSGITKRLIDPNDPLMIWDAEFYTAEDLPEIDSIYEPIVDFAPFAFNCAGDFWAEVCLPDDKETFVALCYHDDLEAEGYGQNIYDFVFRRTVEFAGLADLSGTYGWDITSAKELVSEIIAAFDELMTPEKVAVLKRLLNSPGVHVWQYPTLIYEDEMKSIVEQHFAESRFPSTFTWTK